MKHHPVDRGRKDYAKCIMRLAQKFGISDRVLIFYDVFLPSCLKNAKGTITINSTVGLSSVLHGTPTITLGRAVYDMPGLTNHAVPLQEFWHHQIATDNELFQKYRCYLIHHTQLNGSFYGDLPQFDFSEEMAGLDNFPSQ
ncbi:MAG: hypothetical protein JXR44_01905 [Thiotrichales bacterium]|nr:hypothetical protein [Thiotrichales bacterium]